MADSAVVSPWIKSSLCTTGACVEVLLGDAVVSMRDSKLNGVSRQMSLEFDPGLWGDFLDRVCSEPDDFSLSSGVSVLRQPNGDVVVAQGKVHLRFFDEEWVAFCAGVSAGEFAVAAMPVA